MDLVTLINDISNEEIRSLNILELYDAITRRRRIYFMKIFLTYIFIISLINYYYWKQLKEYIHISIIIFSIIPLIPASIYSFYTNIINPRYHYSEFISYITSQDNDQRIIEFNKELIVGKLKEVHELIENFNKECVICLKKRTKYIKLKCSRNGFHGGCIDCITEWYKKSNTCPECRQKIFDDNIFI